MLAQMVLLGTSFLRQLDFILLGLALEFVGDFVTVSLFLFSVSIYLSLSGMHFCAGGAIRTHTHTHTHTHTGMHVCADGVFRRRDPYATFSRLLLLLLLLLPPRKLRSYDSAPRREDDSTRTASFCVVPYHLLGIFIFFIYCVFLFTSAETKFFCCDFFHLFF